MITQEAPDTTTATTNGHAETLTRSMLQSMKRAARLGLGATARETAAIVRFLETFTHYGQDSDDGHAPAAITLLAEHELEAIGELIEAGCPIPAVEAARLMAELDYYRSASNDPTADRRQADAERQRAAALELDLKRAKQTHTKERERLQRETEQAAADRNAYRRELEALQGDYTDLVEAINSGREKTTDPQRLPAYIRALYDQLATIASIVGDTNDGPTGRLGRIAAALRKLRSL